MNILRIANASGHTSAPLNSFTLARNRFYNDEIITFLSFFKNNKEAVNLFFQKFEKVANVKMENLTFLEANGNIKKFWKMASNWIINSRRDKRSIIHLHQPRSGFLTAIAAKIYNKKIPIIYTVHNNFKNFSFKHKITLFLNFLLVDKITFVSNDAYKSFALYMLFFRNKSKIIQNGVDVERIDNIIKGKSTLNNNKNNKINIISTGRFTKQKNQGFLLDVLENYKCNWKLNIYGTGKYKNELNNQILKKGLSESVTLKQTVPREEIIEAYFNADVYISTALWEGLPVAVMEAMATGLPCLVSDIPSHRELGENLPGLSIIKFNINDWHKALDYWCLLDNKERELYGGKNKKVIYNNFTMRIMQKNYRDLYEDLIKIKSN